jgi:isocitrate dehydrogenase
MAYQQITIQTDSENIRVHADNAHQVPNRPIIPFIEGDRIAIDITPVMREVVDAVVKVALARNAPSPRWNSAPERMPARYMAPAPDCLEMLETIRKFSVAIKESAYHACGC